MKRTGVVLLFLFCIAAFSFGECSEYVYEYGKDIGTLIDNHDGRIPEGQPVTKDCISVPPGNTVSYVRLTIDASSPPQVTFSPFDNCITITFTWPQSSRSYYRVLVKAV